MCVERQMPMVRILIKILNVSDEAFAISCISHQAEINPRIAHYPQADSCATSRPLPFTTCSLLSYTVDCASHRHGYDLEKKPNKGEFMLWRGRRESDNRLKTGEACPVEARNRWRTRRRGLLLIAMFLAVDPERYSIKPERTGVLRQHSPRASGEPADDELKHFVAVVLADTEDVWDRKSSDKPGENTATPNWFFSRIRCSLPAGRLGARRGLFIVRAIRRCTLTSRFIAI